VEVPQTRYARSGDVNMAYQVGGTGACDLVWIPGFVQHVELAWEEPYRAHWLARLAERFRLIVFDKRGTGLSDRIVGEPSLETRMDDSRAVPGAAGSDRAAVAAAATPAPGHVVCGDASVADESARARLDVGAFELGARLSMGAAA